MDSTVKKIRYSILGAAGYIAERHVKAIDAVGGEVVAICDVNDSVGYIDKYFPNCKFYRDAVECLDRVAVDYVVVCTPNDRHFFHTWEAARRGYNVICEKPLVTSSGELKFLESRRGGSRINTILQLRYHADVAEIKKIISKRGERAEIFIDYIAPRGDWYAKSWKGDAERSGGLLFNIGIHLFDLISFLLGDPVEIPIAKIEDRHAEGVIVFENADVSWRLTTENNKAAKKIIRVNGGEYSFSKNFEDLHTKSHYEILAGRGFGIVDAMPSTLLIERIKKGVDLKCYAEKN